MPDDRRHESADLEDYEVLDGADTLNGAPGDDPLDRGIVTPEHWSAGMRFGSAAAEQGTGESQDQLLAAEEPDIGSDNDGRSDEPRLGRERDGRGHRQAVPEQDLIHGRDACWPRTRWPMTQTRPAWSVTMTVSLAMRASTAAGRPLRRRQSTTTLMRADPAVENQDP